MGLVNLQTNLKSLRFGKDRKGGGNSNQPYIKSNIPSGRSSDVFAGGGSDFLLRGGTLTPQRIVDDTSRITQMFFDTKSPNGFLFTAKQNLLSRISTSPNGEDGRALNNGIYLPTSTILQTAGNPIGLHLNKQGIDPFKGLNGGNGVFGLFDRVDPLGNPYYTDIVNRNNQETNDNRLIKIYNRLLTNSGETVIEEYQGGPQSILGIGKTQIRRSEKTNEYTGKTPGTFEFENYNSTKFKDKRPIGETINGNLLNVSLKGEGSIIKNRLGVSFKWYNKYKELLQASNTISLGTIGINNESLLNDTLDSLTNTLTTFPSPEDLRKDIPRNEIISKTIYVDSLNIKRIEERIHLGDPGNSKGSTTEALDKINFKKLYKSEEPQSENTNDLVKFRIGVIDNDNPSLKTYIHFRAFIDSFSDSYSSSWDTQQYTGRGEKFYNYSSFDRDINLSWTVVAQSQPELIQMYKKLNYLASTLTPDYSNSGYMRGNLITLTVGGYLYEQPGFISSLTLDTPQESPWDIGRDPETGEFDSNVKELPLMIKVSGVKFTPIHQFAPKLQQNGFNGIGGNISKYGKERFIALSNGQNTNYSII